MTDGAPSQPPGRKVVVVRAGPDKKRPLIIDGIFGAVGLILLIAAIGLVNVLPEEDVVEPQYKVSFQTITDTQANNGQPFASRSMFLLEGASGDITYDVTHHNVHVVGVTVIAIDDHPATLPDKVSVELIAPNGTTWTYTGGDNGLILTAPTMTNEDNSGTQFYVSDTTKSQRLANFPIRPVPRDYFVTADPDAELFEVREQVRANHEVQNTIGTWTVRLTLVEAGDCPAADPTSPLFQRSVECRMQTPNDGDPPNAPEGYQPGDPSQPDRDLGNVFTVNFEYSFHEVQVTQE